MKPVAPVTVALRPAAGARLIPPPGTTTLDGLALPPGRDMPAEGCLVPHGIWSHHHQKTGDAVLVPDADVARGAKAAEAREKPPADTGAAAPAAPPHDPAEDNHA